MAVLKKKLNTVLCSLFIFMYGFTYAADVEDDTYQDDDTVESVDYETDDGVEVTITDSDKETEGDTSQTPASTSPESTLPEQTDQQSEKASTEPESTTDQTKQNLDSGTSLTETKTDAETTDTQPAQSHDTSLSESETTSPSSEPDQNNVEKEKAESEKIKADSEKAKADLTQASRETDKESSAEVGIDTIHLSEPQGNWLFKRIWWERAEEKYEKIRKYVESVFEARSVFLAQRADIDKNVLDPFYITIGFGQGELKRIIDELVHRLEQEQHDKNGLSPDQQAILQELYAEKDTFKQIKRDIEGVITIDKQITDSLNALFEQINRVRGYERTAWKNFKEIARVLSDTEARKLYYEMDILAKNITDIQAYIRQEFSKHFEQLDTLLKQQISKLQTAIETLKDKGLELGKQLEKFEKKAETCPVVKPVEPEPEEQPQPGFFEGYILQPINAVWDYIRTTISSLYAWVSGTHTEQNSEESDEK